jgi:lipoprotein-releasing system permease protein
VMALVISMALMTGYRQDLQQKLLGGNAEVFVYSIGSPIADPRALQQVLEKTPGVAEASPVLFQTAVVTTEKNTTGAEVMFKGVEPTRGKSSMMLAKIIGPRGRFETAAGEIGVSVGKHLASRIGVKEGSSITVTIPTTSGGTFMPRTASFVVTNVFDTGFYEYDARWMFIDLEQAQELTGVRTANLVEVKLVPGADLDAVVAQIERRTERGYAVNDWREMNQGLFTMLKFQQLILFIVIGLIVFVSTFNIVSTLIMTVHEKRKEIGILTSMGGDRKLVGRIFLWYGTMVGFVGTAAGVVLGAVICWIMTRYELLKFPPEIAEVYFVSSIPFITRAADLGIIAGFSLFVSFIATVLPSIRAARMNPIRALRHE